MRRTLAHAWAVVLVLVITASPVAADESAAGLLRIGWASTDLTPDGPVVIAGGSRARVSESVLDPVTATALAIESVRADQPAGAVVMVSCDLLFITDSLRDRVRERVRQSVPEIEPKCVVLNATHTHTAPSGFTDPEIVEKLARYDLEVPVAWSAWGIDLGTMPPPEYLPTYTGHRARYHPGPTYQFTQCWRALLEIAQ
jgi:hypothetical protein